MEHWNYYKITMKDIGQTEVTIIMDWKQNDYENAFKRKLL